MLPKLYYGIEPRRAADEFIPAGGGFRQEIQGKKILVNLTAVNFHLPVAFNRLSSFHVVLTCPLAVFRDLKGNVILRLIPIRKLALIFSIETFE